MSPSKPQLVAATGLTIGVLVVIAAWAQSRLGASLLPHSFCITASPALLWVHVLGDGLIAVAYLLIPWTMVSLIHRRRDIPFGWIAWLFGAFIVACGLTHAMEVWTLWDPLYWYSGTLKAFTAAVSLASAWLLYRLTPQVLALPSAEQLRGANATLEREIEKRRVAEAQLTQAKVELEEALRKTTADVQQLGAVLDRFFDAAPVGLVLMDPDTRVLRINPALPRASGRDPGEYMGRRLHEIRDMPAQAVEAVRAVAATRKARNDLEFFRTEPSGKERHLRASYFPIELPSGGLLLGGIVQNVTEQRWAEQQRREALAAAEQANRAKDQFIAKVSHELRSPLQVALSSAEVLKRLHDLPAAGRKIVDRLAHSVAMQARMINDLLDLSRILSGKFNVVNEPVDPALPLLRVIDHWSAVAQAQGVRVDAASLQPGRAMVEADAARLEQVFGNLLDNAIRFSREGGEIRVIAETAASSWRLEVRDFGAGMSAEEVQRVFNPFVQGNGQPRGGKGLGLGLTIVRSLVEAFRGHVWAHSDGPGTGSTFIVELPLLSEDRLPSSDLSGEDIAPRLDGLRILYVEDEQDVARAMQDGLSGLGAQVVIATSFDQAMQVLERESLDVLVTDLNLGDGPGGEQLAAAVRNMPRHATLPIIAVSAFGTEADRAASRTAGVVEHLVKPVHAAAVAVAVDRAMRLAPGPL